MTHVKRTKVQIFDDHDMNYIIKIISGNYRSIERGRKKILFQRIDANVCRPIDQIMNLVYVSYRI